MKEEEGRRIVAVDAFHMAEKSIQELKTKLPRRREKEKELQLPWTALKDKQKAKGYYSAMPRTSWPPPRTSWPPPRSRSLL